MNIVGAVAAAGYATRLQPLSCSKEVLEIGGRPVMDYVIERMRLAGCDDVRVVTRSEKADVIAHALAIGARVVEAHPATPGESFAAAIAPLADDDVVLIGWPDTIWEPEDGYVPLVEKVADGAEVALGLFKTPDLQRSDVIRFDDGGRITGIEIKPYEPPSEWIWGCAAARARLLRGLGDVEWPGAYFDMLCRDGVELEGVLLSDSWLDIGTPESLYLATTDPRYAGFDD